MFFCIHLHVDHVHCTVDVEQMQALCHNPHATMLHEVCEKMEGMLQTVTRSVWEDTRSVWEDERHATNCYSCILSLNKSHPSLVLLHFQLIIVLHQLHFN